MSQESQDLHDRVTEILNAAEASSGSMLGDGDGESDGTGEADLRETAEEASDLLESAEPKALLEAVGLGTLPDSSEPDSIPEAIARGDPEQVADLRRLLHLSNLAEADDDGALEGAVDDLRSTVGEQTADAQRAETDEGDGDSDEDETGTADEDADDETETPESEGGGESDIGDRLRSAMTSSFEDFGDDVQQLRDRLEEASAGVTGDTDESDEGGRDADGTEAAETEADEADEEEEGLLGSGLGSGERDASTGGAARHSTMAPPPSKRADMRTTRFSTMPDKHRD